MCDKLDEIIQNKYKYKPYFKESKITVQYVNYEILQIGEKEWLSILKSSLFNREDFSCKE